MRTTLIVLLLLLVALIWLNPDMEDFRKLVEERSEEMLVGETGGSDLGRALARAGGSLAGAYVDRLAERRNYIVYSTYVIDFDGEEETANEWRFLGLAGQFIELQRPEALREE